MPSGSIINGRNQTLENDEPVAVVALANALLDMSVAVKDDSLIKKYALPCDGQIEVTQEQLAVFSEVLQNYPVEYVAGGSAQNTLRILCKLIHNRWPCFVMGTVGRDRIGTILQDLLAQDGVKTRYTFNDELPTGCCVAMVRPDGTRCLAANIGAAREFRLEDFDMVQGGELVDRTRILFVEGFFASHSPDVAMAALQRSHSRGGVIRLVSLSAQYVCKHSCTILRRLLSYANLVVGNEDEFRTLAESAGLVKDANSLPMGSVARKIAALDYVPPANQFKSCRLADFQGASDWDWTKLNERLAIVTCGSSGAICATRTDCWEFPIEKLPPHQVKDTTGAGDAFLAGFISQLLSCRPLDACVATGQQTARAVITQTGCRLPA